MFYHIEVKIAKINLQ